MGIHLLTSLWHDEAGFIVSSEVVLIGTITVLGMIVGLSEVAFNINKELGDVATAFGHVNQGYHFPGMSSGDGENQEDSGSSMDCDAPPTPEG